MKNAYFRLPVNLTGPVEIDIYETPVNLVLIRPKILLIIYVVSKRGGCTLCYARGIQCIDERVVAAKQRLPETSISVCCFKRMRHM